ncbi:hypothetical protein BDZ90DRAFT_259971 [Jaminaea rosea]|uniref:DOD-type homing endonuclease domain-containing protein n=1 Tax=Jaminaea rosea TaxID=1569628 RepID=A0A316US86_9BASI|nr:hypothetical protein BDZ90DRAFT_259971 [Jaminaea rosea]PWN28147.1 hypothetical protein BDZ90DRAFT_259971 [Jaminaea rosea]
MTLGLDTIVHTFDGLRTVGTLQQGQLLYDVLDALVQVSLGPATPIVNPYRIEYNHVTSGQNVLYLYAAGKTVSPLKPLLHTMLALETTVPTYDGPKSVASLQDGQLVYDHLGALVPVALSPATPIIEPYNIEYNHIRGQTRRYITSGSNVLYLYAAGKTVPPLTPLLEQNARNRHDRPHVRRAEACHPGPIVPIVDAYRLEYDRVRGQTRHYVTSGDNVLYLYAAGKTKPTIEPSRPSTLKWFARCDHGMQQDDLEGADDTVAGWLGVPLASTVAWPDDDDDNDEDWREGSDDDDDEVQDPPLSSEPWRQDANHGAVAAADIATTVHEKECTCGGIAKVERKLVNPQAEQHFLAAAKSGIASHLIAPNIVQPRPSTLKWFARCEPATEQDDIPFQHEDVDWLGVPLAPIQWPADDDDGDEDWVEEGADNNTANDDDDDDDDDYEDPPLSSEPWRQDNNYSAVATAGIASTVEEKACDCGGPALLQRQLDSPTIAQHFLAAAESDIADHLLASNIVKPRDADIITASAWANAPHGQGPQQKRASLLKMCIVKHWVLEGASSWASMPLHPYYLGLWMGDGHANGTAITTVEDATMAFLESYVASLNASRPPWAAALYVRYIDSTSPLSTKTCWRCKITSRAQHGGDPACWNPVRSALGALGILDNSKVNGFPDLYKHSAEDVRAAALAGFLDSDGSVHCNGYRLTQSVAHAKAIHDARDIARSLGIRAGEVQEQIGYKPDGSPAPILAVYFSGQALEKL